MSHFLASHLWTQLWQITLLIPAVILLTRYMLPKSPHIRYALLLIVLVKTIFPPIWDSPTGILWESLPLTQSSVSEVSERKSATKVSAESSTAAAEQSEAVNATPLAVADHQRVESRSRVASAMFQIPWRPVLISAWGLGALILLGYVLGKRAQLIRFHRDTQVTPSDELLEQVELVSAELGLVKTPPVLVTLHPTVPFASGFLKQIVVLPAHLVEQTPTEELKLILAHEMTHLRRGDTLIGVLQLFVQMVWWFHPLVYWLNIDIRRMREECCDQDVVSQLNCQPASYARCLINMLELQQKLRPSTELVGLSPVEVTAQRMQNIMHSASRTSSTWRAIAYGASLSLFALLILPARATSMITPKVIVGEIVPEGVQPEPRIARPRISQIAPSSLQSESANAVLLKYDWIAGEKLKYAVTLSAHYPTEVRTHTGESEFEVNSAPFNESQLSPLASSFDLNVTPREDVQLPKLPEPEPSPFDFPGRRFGSEIFTEPPMSPFARSQPPPKATGSNKHVDPSSGHLPYLLGDLQDWIFPSLPQQATSFWNEEFDQDVTITDDSVIAPTLFSASPQKHLTATITARTKVVELTPHSVQLHRVWNLETQEGGDGQPEREVTINGSLTLDAERGFLSHANYTGKLVERAPNREVRIPLVLELQRIE